MHLVYDIYFVLARLWCKPHLVHQFADVVHRVVAGGVQFEYVERGLVGKALAGGTFSAGLHIGRGAFAIDGFGQYARAGGLAHTPRTAKQVRMRQVVVPDSIFEGSGNVLLPYYCVEGLGAVFTRRYYVI